MQLNYLAILLATAAQFALGFVWYGSLFGNLWGKMHGFDKLSKEVQKQMMKKMGPLYFVQLMVTIMTTVVLAIFLAYQPTWNAYAMAGFFWLGFIVPTQITGVMFGGTKPQWFVTKLLIMMIGSFVMLEAATAILQMWK